MTRRTSDVMKTKSVVRPREIQRRFLNPERPARGVSRVDDAIFSLLGRTAVTRETAVISFVKRGMSDGTSEDLKIKLHFILHLDHSATDTDGRDSKISLFENGACRVGLAGLFHGQADRFADTV